MFYTFNLNWAFLDRLEVSILCSISTLENRTFSGSLAELYRLTLREYEKKKVQTKTRNELRGALDNLSKSGYIEYSTNGKNIHFISIIPDEDDIEVFSSILEKTKQTTGTPWANQIKLYLYIILAHKEKGEDHIFTMEQIGRDFGVSDSTVTNIKNALVESGILQSKVIKECSKLVNKKSDGLDIVEYDFRTVGTKLFPSAF